MKKFFVFCLALAFSLGCGSVASPRYTRPPQQMDQINHAVVALVRENADAEWDTYCSGAFVGDNTVLTAAHCVDSAEDDTVYISVYEPHMPQNYETSHYTFYVSRSDEDYDLALLRKLDDGQPLPYHSQFLVGLTAPVQGENVVLMGHPLGLGWTLTSGVVSSDHRQGWDSVPYEDVGWYRPLFIQHDAQAYPGSSGGPLLNYNNELVGVLVQGHQMAEYLVMSVHTDTVNDFLTGQAL